jgi:hypothetical protein
MSIITKTFRYKTDILLQEELEYFAKVHQFDDKKSLKENFKKWLEQENISKLLEQENRRLESLNYCGSLYQKLFTSLKYYHIKNLKTPPPPPLPTEPEPSIVLNDITNEPMSPQNTEPRKRDKQKNSVELLQKIEQHILFMMKQDAVIADKTQDNSTQKPEKQLITISPNDAFKDYLVNEMAVEKDEEVIKKVKKIYKNKMFHLQKKLTKTPTPIINDGTRTTTRTTSKDDNITPNRNRSPSPNRNRNRNRSPSPSPNTN